MRSCHPGDTIIHSVTTLFVSRPPRRNAEHENNRMQLVPVYTNVTNPNDITALRCFHACSLPPRSFDNYRGTYALSPSSPSPTLYLSLSLCFSFRCVNYTFDAFVDSLSFSLFLSLSAFLERVRSIGEYRCRTAEHVIVM